MRHVTCYRPTKSSLQFGSLNPLSPFISLALTFACDIPTKHFRSCIFHTPPSRSFYLISILQIQTSREDRFLIKNKTHQLQICQTRFNTGLNNCLVTGTPCDVQHQTSIVNQLAPPVRFLQLGGDFDCRGLILCKS